MKKWISLICVLLLLMSMTACGDNTIESVGGNIDNNSSKTTNTAREPLPTYGKLGVNNSMATTDGRYIYYSYFDTEKSEGRLCRTDMNGENAEELWSQTYQKFSDLHINDGYLYLSYGRIAYHIDIATAPNYFKGKNGSVENIPIVDNSSASKFKEISKIQTDSDYIYFSSTGLWRVKKDTTGLEQIVYSENLVNFYDLKLIDGCLYAYCGDDQKLYRINTDGSNITEVCKPMESYIVYEDSVYYIVSGDNHLQQLTKTKLDGSGTQIIATLGEGWEFATLHNAVDDKLFYSYKSGDIYELRTFDISTSLVNTICQLDGTVDSVDIVDNFIFFKYADEKLMKMNIDGTNIEQVGK